MRINSLVIFLLGVFLFTSCGDQPLYENVQSFKERKWSQDVKPVYSVDIENINAKYDFTLTLRTTTDYKYSNLWIFMKTESPDGTSAREPFEILITNPDGSWIGNKTGTVVETPLYFRSRKLPLKGKYKFTIEQGITDSEIDEVLDLSFTVNESKQD